MENMGVQEKVGQGEHFTAWEEAAKSGFLLFDASPYVRFCFLTHRQRIVP
jgi:hypothetical protein